MGCRDDCRSACTCAKATQGFSRFLSYFTCLLTLLSLSLVGWSMRCAPCINPTDPLYPNNTEVCHYMGLFQWCEAIEGYQYCWTFHPRTLDRGYLARTQYAAAQAFMIMAGIVSAFYVAVDVANWFVRLTQDDEDVYVMKYSQDSWFFYLITFFHALFSLVAQALWATQQHKLHNQHQSHACGPINFHPGSAFALSAVVWVLCVVNIIWRLIFRKFFRDPESSSGSGGGNVEMSRYSN